MSFLADNEHRHYPFQDKEMAWPLPKSFLVDLFLRFGPSVDYVPSLNPVSLSYCAHIGSEVVVQLSTSALEAPIVVNIPDNVAEFTIVRSSSDGEEGTSSDGLSVCDSAWEWEISLVVGKIQDLVDYLDTFGPQTDSSQTIVLEPSRIQSTNSSFVRTVSIFNEDRTRAQTPNGCDPLPIPPRPDNPFFAGTACNQSLLVKEGFNISIAQIRSSNSLRFSAGVGSGEGPSCEGVVLFPGETVYPETGTLDGALTCSDVIGSINGVSQKNFTLTVGTGVSLTLDPDNNKITVNFDLSGLAVCPPDVISSSDGNGNPTDPPDPPPGSSSDPSDQPPDIPDGSNSDQQSSSTTSSSDMDNPQSSSGPSETLSSSEPLPSSSVTSSSVAESSIVVSSSITESSLISSSSDRFSSSIGPGDCNCEEDNLPIAPCDTVTRCLCLFTFNKDNNQVNYSLFSCYATYTGDIVINNNPLSSLNGFLNYTDLTGWTLQVTGTGQDLTFTDYEETCDESGFTLIFDVVIPEYEFMGETIPASRLLLTFRDFNHCEYNQSSMEGNSSALSSSSIGADCCNQIEGTGLLPFSNPCNNPVPACLCIVDLERPMELNFPLTWIGCRSTLSADKQRVAWEYRRNGEPFLEVYPSGSDWIVVFYFGGNTYSTNHLSFANCGSPSQFEIYFNPITIGASEIRFAVFADFSRCAYSSSSLSDGGSSSVLSSIGMPSSSSASVPNEPSFDPDPGPDPDPPPLPPP